MDHGPDDPDDSKTTSSDAAAGRAGRPGNRRRAVRSPDEKLRLVTFVRRSGNVRAACRTTDLSRSSVYRWWRRVQAEGQTGLADPDPHRPHPEGRVDPILEAIIVQHAYDHPQLSAPAIAERIKRLGWAGSPTGVRCVLVRHGLETYRKRKRAAAAHASGPAASTDGGT